MLGMPIIALLPGLSTLARVEALLTMSRLAKKSKPALMAWCSADGLNCRATGSKKKLAMRLTSKMFPGLVIAASGACAVRAQPKTEAPAKIAITRGDLAWWALLSPFGVKGRAIYDSEASRHPLPESDRLLLELMSRVEQAMSFPGTFAFSACSGRRGRQLWSASSAGKCSAMSHASRTITRPSHSQSRILSPRQRRRQRRRHRRRPLLQKPRRRRRTPTSRRHRTRPRSSREGRDE